MLTARSRRTKQVLISSFGVDEGSSSETLEHGVGRYAIVKEVRVVDIYCYSDGYEI